MKLIGCGRTRALLAARAAGLSANEQDALDAHLQTCGDCREQARLLDEIVLAVGVMPSRTPAARERTIERALRQGLEQACKPPFWKSRSALTVGTVVLGGALAATVALVIMRGSERPLQPTLVERPNLRPQETPLASEPRDLPAGVEVAVAHARVRAVRRASISWNEKAATVKLDSGAIELDVDPALQRGFRVITDAFVVEVLGTHFTVDAAHVEVSRGTVRVLAPDGRVLVARLQMGQTWSPVQVAPAISEPAAQPERRTHAAQPADVAEQLARARRDLANGQVARAEKEASSILAGSRERRQEAEARTLLAECAQARGKIDQAIATYAVVAERFGDLPAGETALFAAGRTLADAGRRVSATHWLHRYLDRYPSGRFTVEAKERLAGFEGNQP